jgi:hypothetical protein
MKITHANYYSKEANEAYFTASQIKTYMSCPSQWLATRRGLYEREESDALFQGQYVDTALTEPDKFDQFCIDNADKIYGRGKKKYKAIADIDRAIARVQRDEKFMYYLTGETQFIIVIEDFYGYPYKAMLDCVNFEEFFLTDLKTTRGIDAEEWIKLDDGTFGKVSWITRWRYPMQLALYREALYHEYQCRPHPYIAAMEKTKVPNFDVFDMYDKWPLDGELQRAVDAMHGMAEVVHEDDPLALRQCKTCEWCLSNKKIIEPIKFEYDPRMLQF